MAASPDDFNIFGGGLGNLGSSSQVGGGIDTAQFGVGDLPAGNYQDFNSLDYIQPQQTPFQDYASKHEVQYNIPEQEPTWGQWWDKNTTGQLGVDNAFRLGSIGLSGLGMVGALDQQNKARKSYNSAINWLTSQEDPNAKFYQQRLGDIMRDRNGYLTDVVTQNKMKTLEDTMRRQASAQGRAGLNADEIRALQGVAQGAYQDERDTLIKLRERQAQIDAQKADLMSSAPSASPINAVLPGLANIYNTGQEYAVSQGYGSDPRFRTSQQQQQFRQQEARRIFSSLDADTQKKYAPIFNTNS